MFNLSTPPRRYLLAASTRQEQEYITYNPETQRITEYQVKGDPITQDAVLEGMASVAEAEFCKC